MRNSGIPYMGSKRKIAVDILNVIRQRHHDVENFYDLFGGGGAVSLTAGRLFKNVFYNELQKHMVELLKQLQKGFPPEWWQPVTREQFFEQLDKYTAFAGMVKTCWSFGNDQRSYLYGKDIEEIKLSAHDFIVNNTEEARLKINEITGLNLPLFRNELSFYDRGIAVKKQVKGRFVLERLQSLERLESLQSLERVLSLERLASLKPRQGLHISNLSYEKVPIMANSVIYCDPPYADTADYNVVFDHDKFYEWALECDFPVYISEYNMPKEFEQVCAFAHRSSFAVGRNDKTVEKLFWNRKGEPFITTLF